MSGAGWSGEGASCRLNEMAHAVMVAAGCRLTRWCRVERAHRRSGQYASISNQMSRGTNAKALVAFSRSS